MVTSTRPSAAPITRSRPSRTVASEPEASSWKTLVESQTRASTPSSPIARQLGLGGRLAELRRVVDLPVAGVEDAAVRRLDQQRIALRDRMGERHVAKRERPELGTRPRISTMLTLTLPVSPSSSSFPAISPAVNGVA